MSALPDKEFADFLARWSEKWTSLAEDLAARHPIEWDVWSHRLGDQDKPSGHTMGLELRSEDNEYSDQVFCLVDLSCCEGDWTIELVELASNSKNGRDRKRPFAEALALDEESLRETEQALVEWEAEIERLLALPHPLSVAGFFSCGGGPDPRETAKGDEPDFELWKLYLESRDDPGILSHGVGPTDESDLGRSVWTAFENRILTEFAPDLEMEAFADMTIKQGLLFEDSHFPETTLINEMAGGEEGYRGAWREITALHPGTSGVTCLSRVGFGAKQAFFLAMHSGVQLGMNMDLVICYRVQDGWELEPRMVTQADMNRISMERLQERLEAEERDGRDPGLT